MRRNLGLVVDASPVGSDNDDIIPILEEKEEFEWADPNPSLLPFPLPPGILRVQNLLGEGAEGAVYRVETAEHGDCAFKWSYVYRNDVNRHRLLEEGRALEAVGHHPNVVHYYGHGTVVHQKAEYDWILMALHQGDVEEWMDFVRRKPVELDEDEQKMLGELMNPDKLEKRVLRDALAGLEHMHAQGYIHRDVKLTNMGLASNPLRIVVGDLGFSRCITRPDGTLIPEQERTFRPGGTAAYLSTRTERGQHQYFGDDIQSLLFAFLASTYFYGSFVFFQPELPRLFDKEEFLRDPAQFGRLSEQRQKDKLIRKKLDFVQSSLAIGLARENISITDHLFKWYLVNQGQEALRRTYLTEEMLMNRVVPSVRSAHFFMLLLGWSARLHRVTLDSLCRNLLTQLARETSPQVVVSRAAWETLVEFSGAPLDSYLFPFIRSALARHLSQHVYQGKPLWSLARLFVSDLVFVSRELIAAGFPDLDVIPATALLAVDRLDETVNVENPAREPLTLVKPRRGRIVHNFNRAPRVVAPAFGVDRISDLGVETVNALVVFEGGIGMPIRHLRELEIDGAEWADAKTGQFPLGVIVLARNDEVSIYVTKRHEDSLTDRTVALPPPLSPPLKFRASDSRVSVRLFNIVDLVIRLVQ